MNTANILICEDEALVAKDIENFLRKSGYNVVASVASGEEALSVAEEKHPDIALMDIRLAGAIDGVDTAAKLADDFEIPSIFLTAHADENTLDNAKQTSPLGYLMKPFNEQELKAAVEMGLHRHKAFKRSIEELQRSLDNVYKGDLVEHAVRLEQDFAVVEKRDSQLRAASCLADKVLSNIKLMKEVLEPLLEDGLLDEKTKNTIRGALIHHDRTEHAVSKVIECRNDDGVSLERAEICSVILEAVEAAQKEIGGELSTINCFSPGDHYGVVDREKLQMALKKVLLNAHQSLAQNPVISISTSLIYEGFPERYNQSSGQGWYVEIKVTDAGCGISADALERVFEPGFSQFGSPMHLGLGLSYVHSVMQAHTGWVSVDSEEGVGTTVSMYVRCANPPGSKKFRRGSKSARDEH